MSKPISSTLSQSDIDPCKTFGHRARRYGDGIFCEWCDIPMNDSDVHTTDMGVRLRVNEEGVVQETPLRMEDLKKNPDWVRNLQTGMPSLRYKPQRERIVIP